MPLQQNKPLRNRVFISLSNGLECRLHTRSSVGARACSGTDLGGFTRLRVIVGGVEQTTVIKIMIGISGRDLHKASMADGTQFYARGMSIERLIARSFWRKGCIKIKLSVTELIHTDNSVSCRHYIYYRNEKYYWNKLTEFSI